MSTLLAVMAILSGLLVLLLAVPIDVAFRFQGIEAFKGQITVRWLFGLLRYHMRIPESTTPQARPRGTRPNTAKAQAKGEERGGRTGVLAVLRQAEFRRRLYRLAHDVVHAAHLHELGLRMRLGLGDPADTGRLWVLVGPLTLAAQSLRNARVNIEPEFMDAVFEFEAHGRFLLVPLQFLALAIAFALSPPSIRAWRALRPVHA